MHKIGQGSFGTVYLDGDKIQKVMYLKDPHGNLLHQNMNEIVFLKSFAAGVPFLPQVYKIDMQGNQNIVTMQQSFCGHNLNTISANTPYHDRIMALPKLMVQMARILMWLKAHRIAHMDISPGNICINHAHNMYLIDFGFVSPVNINGPNLHGTYSYGDPSYFTAVKCASHAYDMFSCGMSLVSFLSCAFIKQEEWCNAFRWSTEQRKAYLHKTMALDFHISSIRALFPAATASNLVTGLLGMLEIEEVNRIKPARLYGLPCFRDLRELYPIVPKQQDEAPVPDIAMKWEPIPSWIHEVLICMSAYHLIGFTTKLLRRLYARLDVSEDHNLYAAACAYIAAMITHNVMVMHSILRRIDKRNLHFAIFHTHTLLETNVYPKDGMADWDITFTSLAQYVAWNQSLYENDFMAKSELAKRAPLKKLLAKMKAIGC